MRRDKKKPPYNISRWWQGFSPDESKVGNCLAKHNGFTRTLLPLKKRCGGKIPHPFRSFRRAAKAIISCCQK